MGFIVGFLNDRTGILFEFYDVVRPKLVSSGGKKCLRKLDEKGVQYSYLGDVGEETCLIKDGVWIDNLPKTRLSSGIQLNCNTALDFVNWAEEIEARHIVHMGSYNCRKMRSLNIMSEHSFGTAIDVAAIDGASVKRDWSKNNNKGKTIKEAASLACKHFSNVITPIDDALHHDHLHLDNGYRSTCLPKWVNRIKKEVIKYAP